jgi:ABC-2 type transport system permease protein
VARFNPANWAVVVGRETLQADVDWGLVASRTGLLVAFAALCAFLSTRAFGAYQRSL